MQHAVETRLASILAANWWVLLLRGVIAIVFGVLSLIQPGITLSALVLLFGFYSFTDGALGVWTAIAGRKQHHDWWLLLLAGLLGIAVGLLTFEAPGVTAFALLFYIAIWAIATGVLQIAAAVRLRKEIENEWLLVFAGLASVVFGFLLMAQPGQGALALVWLIASYAVVFGVLLVVLAFRARSFGARPARV